MNSFLLIKFPTRYQVEIWFRILIMTFYLPAISISWNRNFRMTRCLFIAREKRRAKKGQLCLVSVKDLHFFTKSRPPTLFIKFSCINWKVAHSVNMSVMPLPFMKITLGAENSEIPFFLRVINPLKFLIQMEK